MRADGRRRRDTGFLELCRARSVARRLQLQPIVNVRHRPRQLCIKRPNAPKQRQTILDGTHQRQQRHDLAVEGANGADIRSMRRGVEAQARAEQIKLADIGGDPAPLHLGFRSGLLGQAIGKPAARIRNGASQLLLKGGKHAFGKDETVNDRGADDAERDLLDARHRGVEHRARRKHARKADQGRGIARQHEHV